MSSNDGWFWAGVSGKRAENIQQLNRNIDQWEAHCAELEATIKRLQDARAYWFLQSVGLAADHDVIKDLVIERTGKKPRDLIRTDEYARRRKEKWNAAHKEFGAEWKNPI